ncbi:unnamed protein product [Rhizoctonia solani]|uniref:Uncharacterized protein n=1 Tax=Rhizoctonia solani TaxID=456999 RepID=A0A8H3CAV8_9AGAM|nr:unnamed protein product [Rhizoctonia solani]
MGGAGSGPGVGKATIGTFEFRALGGAPGGFDSANVGVPWLGEGPSPKQLHDAGSSNNWTHPHSGFEPTPNKTAAQKHHGADDPPPRQSADNPPLHVPLPNTIQCNEYKSGWNVGFAAGCVFATRASDGPSSGVCKSQPEVARSMPQVSSVPAPVDRHSGEYEAGWYAGFIAGCEFATRTSGGPQPGILQLQSDPTEPTSRVLSLSSTPPTPNPNNDAPLFRPRTGSGHTITSSPHPEGSGGFGTQAASSQCQDEPGPGTFQVPAATGIRNGEMDTTVLMRHY